MKKALPIIVIIIIVIVLVIVLGGKKDNVAVDGDQGEDTEMIEDGEMMEDENTMEDGDEAMTGVLADIQGQWALEGTTDAFIHIRDEELSYALSGFSEYYPIRIENPFLYVDAPEKEVKYTFNLQDDKLMLMGEGEDEILNLVRP